MGTTADAQMQDVQVPLSQYPLCLCPAFPYMYGRSIVLRLIPYIQPFDAILMGTRRRRGYPHQEQRQGQDAKPTHIRCALNAARRSPEDDLGTGRM